MKEICNLSKKNDYFGELTYESLNDEMKSKTLPMLILMATKKNGVTKNRGCDHGNFPKVTQN